MKSIFFFFLLTGLKVAAQPSFREIGLPVKGDLHLLSPEPIQYVDISSKAVEGDLGLPNLLRLRYRDSSVSGAVVTIAGEKFIAQYRLLPSPVTGTQLIEITSADMRALDISGSVLSHPQLRKIAGDIFCRKPDVLRSSDAFGIKASLNGIYTAGDYIFVDLSYHNETNLRYDIDAFRFKIEDKKVTKASNVQSVELKPELALFGVTSFAKNYRNVFVFRKLSYPGNKVLNIELSEKQISGRVIRLSISYKDLLDADIVSF